MTLRVGLIGAGWVTKHHLEAWKRLGDEAKIVAIADPALEKAEARAKEFGIGSVFESAARMLDDEKLDAVDIAAPREFHADLVRLAADKGVPVLCQKPLAPTLAEAETLVREVGPRTRLMVHENWRFRPYYRQAAAWIRENRLGRIKGASLTLLTSGTVPDAEGRYPALERQPFMAGETRMLVGEVLIHHLDTLRFLLGPLAVQAASLTRACPAIRGEDSATIHLSASDDAGVSVFGSFAAHGSAPQQHDALVVIGEKATLRLEKAVLSINGETQEEIRYDPDEVYVDSYMRTIQHFISCLRSGEPFETSPEDNLMTLKLVEDCYRISNWEEKVGAAA